MTLNSPPLDPRTFDDLLAELKRRIPRYTDDWTDFNESDPGTAIVEMFAWLTETILWEVNQVPSRSYETFLDLLAIKRRPAVPASADLTFTVTGETMPDTISQSAQVTSSVPGPDGAPVLFETLRPIDPVRYPIEAAFVFDSADGSVTGVQNAVGDSTFQPFGPRALQGSALYLGFGKAEEGKVAPRHVFPSRIWLRVFRSDGARGAAPRRTGGPPPAAPVRLVWEYKPGPDTEEWTMLRTYSDDTAGLTREGYIAIEGPDTVLPSKLMRAQAEKRYWLRCRLVDGDYRADSPPTLDGIVANTVPAINLATVHSEVIGISTGRPGQMFQLKRTPVLADALDLEVIDDDELSETWSRVDELYAQGPDAPVFTLDPVTGDVAFGDDINGRIPRAGSQIVAARYRYGGGAFGNVKSGSINALQTGVPGIAGVTNLRRAVGGADTQTEEELKRDAPFALRNKDRAVTAEDYTRLTLEAGGVKAAKAIPNHNPDFPGVRAPGALTVFIVPERYYGTAVAPSPPPVPSADLIGHVCRALDPKRMLTAEVYVAGATFKQVAVSATILAQPDRAMGEVQEACVAALNALLIPPLATKPGPLRFGASLYPSTLIAALEDVPGVVSAQLTGILVDGVPSNSAAKPIEASEHEVLWGSSNHALNVTPLGEDA